MSHFCFAEEDEEEAESAQKSPVRPGANIHLWQFVKELLQQPAQFGNFIHWIDRSKGIFKIVDSVKVATLWGKRKVMNPKYTQKEYVLRIFLCVII